MKSLIFSIVTIIMVTFIMLNPAYSQLADTPWPCFQHDNRHTGQGDYSGPENPSLLWKHEGKFYFLLIGSDGTIITGSNSWNNPDDESYIHKIYPNGTQKSKRQIYDDFNACPALGNEVFLYICSDAGWHGYLENIRIEGYGTGGESWRFPTVHRRSSPPVIGDDGTIYVVSYESYDGNSFLYAVEPNGDESWRLTLDGKHFDFPAPAISEDGTIYVVTLNSGSYLHAVDSEGTEKWRFKISEGRTFSPSISRDGVVYICSWDNELIAVNPDGTEKWRFETGESTYYFNSAIADDGTIYVNSNDGYLYAVNPDGSQKWTVNFENDLDSYPTIGADGTVYVIDDYQLHAVNPDGTKKWSFELSLWDPPVPGADGVLYAHGKSGIYAIGEREAAEPVEFDLHLNPEKAVYNSGDRFELYLDVKTYSHLPPIDLYILMENNEGVFYSYKDLQNNPIKWQKGISPALTNFTLPENLDLEDLRLFEITIPRVNPPIGEGDSGMFIIVAFRTGTFELVSNVALQMFFTSIHD